MSQSKIPDAAHTHAKANRGSELRAARNLTATVRVTASQPQTTSLNER